MCLAKIRCKELLEYDLCCVIPETGILYFFMGPSNNEGALLYYPSDDVSDLVRKPPPDEQDLFSVTPRYFRNCGLIEQKNFFGCVHEVYIGLLGVPDPDLELEEYEFENPEEITFCFLELGYGPYCMTGAMVTNPKKFGKKPFAQEMIHMIFSTD